MLIKVCDALCGEGKTQSCINMMNNDLEHRYIFITPYLTEVERIKTSCAARDFVSPERKTANGFSKLEDIPSLLRAKKNIASTHALFSCYTDEIKELIREGHYILILDEVIDLFQAADFDGKDIEWLKSKKVTEQDGDTVLWKDDNYDGVVFNELMNISKSRNLKQYDDMFFFWALPPDVFMCFDSAYVLTYMFEFQLLKYYFDVCGITYELIGTKRENGIFQFCPVGEMNRRKNLRSRVHIVENERYNEIGNPSFSLSSGWFERATKEAGQPKLMILKNNIYNIFRHYKCENEDKLWTTLNKYKGYLKGKGYTNSFITFNKRATNDFADRHYLAYCLNVFLMPWMKNYLARIGAKEINQDMYALSVLIQWLFRSAVRNGDEVWIYIPSRRMRWLLEEWLKNLEEGKDLTPLKFDARRVPRINEAGYQLKKTVDQKGGRHIGKRLYELLLVFTVRPRGSVRVL